VTFFTLPIMPLIYDVPISSDSGMWYIHSSIIDRASVALRINTEFKSSLKKDTFCSSTTKRNHAMTKVKSVMHSRTQWSNCVMKQTSLTFFFVRSTLTSSPSSLIIALLTLCVTLRKSSWAHWVMYYHRLLSSHVYFLTWQLIECSNILIYLLPFVIKLCSILELLTCSHAHCKTDCFFFNGRVVTLDADKLKRQWF